MECAKIKELLSEYIDGTLDGQMEKLVEEHLSACKNCSEELESLKAYARALSSLPEVEAPEGFLQKVHERVLLQPHGFKKIIRKLFLPLPKKVPLELAGVAVTTVLIIYIVNVMHPVSEIERLSSLTRPEKLARESLGKPAELALKDEKTLRGAPITDEWSAKLRREEQKPIELALLISREATDLAIVNGRMKHKKVKAWGVRRDRGGEVEEKTFPADKNGVVEKAAPVPARKKGKVEQEAEPVPAKRERGAKEKVELHRGVGRLEKEGEAADALAVEGRVEEEVKAHEPARKDRYVAGYKLDELAEDNERAEVIEEALSLDEAAVRTALEEEKEKGVQPGGEVEIKEKGVTRDREMGEGGTLGELRYRITSEEELDKGIEAEQAVVGGIAEKRKFRSAGAFGLQYSSEILRNVKNLIESVQGKVISVEYEEKTNLPQFVTAEIPAKNYSALLEKLGQIGELQKPLPTIAVEGEEPVRLRINLLRK